MNREVDIAWAAGFFDGEGCITSKQHGNIYLILVNTDKQLFDRFFSIVGVGSTRFQRATDPLRHSNKWEWAAYGRDAVKVFQMLSPYLGERRKQRFNEVMAIRREFESNSKDGHTIKYAWA